MKHDGPQFKTKMSNVLPATTKLKKYK